MTTSTLEKQETVEKKEIAEKFSPGVNKSTESKIIASPELQTNGSPDALKVENGTQAAVEEKASPVASAKVDDTPRGLRDNPLEKMASSSRTMDWVTVKKILNFIKGYLVPYQTADPHLNRHLMTMYGLLALSKSCFLAMPLCMKYGINMLTNQSTVLNSISYFLAYGALNTIGSVSDARRGVLIATVIQDAWRLVSLKTYDHLLKLDISYHLGGTKTSLFSIQKAKKGIEANLRFMTNTIIPSFVEITIGCTLLFTQAGIQFTGVFLGSVLAFLLFTRSASKTRKTFVAKQKEQDKILDFLVTESLSNYFLVKHFNAEKIELIKFETVLNKYRKYALENAKALGSINVGQRTIIAVGLTINLILGAMGVHAGTMTPGDLVMVQTLMVQVFQPLHNLGVLSREFVDSYFEIRELFRILEKKPKIYDKPDARDYEYKGGEIVFQNVSFSYVPERPLIQHLNLRIPSKKIIALCGESGVGKTTLYNLLFRFYDPEGGDVFLDGQNIKDLKLESFRDNIGVVSQQPVLFNDTIYNNLLYANPKRTFEEIQDVCKRVGLHDTIMQSKEGYDTVVGDQGAKFSGGERQRLSIARCFLKDPPIILLDEMTSALDARNENQMMQIVDTWRGKKTVVYITHRMHLNDFADSVVMLRKDGTVEQGTHQQLSRNYSSKYYELWHEYLARKTEDLFEGKDSEAEIPYVASVEPNVIYPRVGLFGIAALNGR